MKALSVANVCRGRPAGQAPERLLSVSGYVLAAAPVEDCFNIVSRQLERPCAWDRLVWHAWPVSSRRERVGAMSRVLINFDGQVSRSSAIITRYDRNSAFKWSLTAHPGVSVSWSLTPGPKGTRVALTLSWKTPQGPLSRFLRRTRVANDVHRTLVLLKTTVEDSAADAAE